MTSTGLTNGVLFFIETSSTFLALSFEPVVVDIMDKIKIKFIMTSLSDIIERIYLVS